MQIFHYFIVFIIRHKKFHMCGWNQARCSHQTLIIYLILIFVILEAAAPLYWSHGISLGQLIRPSPSFFLCLPHPATVTVVFRTFRIVADPSKLLIIEGAGQVGASYSI